MKSRISIFMAALVFAAMSISASLALAADTHKGTFVSLAGEKLTMTGSDGKEHSHTVATDVKYVVDGKDAKASDLKPGMKIRVTTIKAADGKTAVTMVEGLDKHPDFGT